MPPLVRGLNLIIKRSEHLVIMGSNGVRTAIACMLVGLWYASGDNAKVIMALTWKPLTNDQALDFEEHECLTRKIYLFSIV